MVTAQGASSRTGATGRRRRGGKKTSTNVTGNRFSCNLAVGYFFRYACVASCNSLPKKSRVPPPGIISAPRQARRVPHYTKRSPGAVNLCAVVVGAIAISTAAQTSLIPPDARPKFLSTPYLRHGARKKGLRSRKRGAQRSFFSVSRDGQDSRHFSRRRSGRALAAAIATGASDTLWGRA
jgi:hypothetical protein